MLGIHAQAVDCGYGSGFFGHCVHIEALIIVQFRRYREHLEWSGEVEDFNVIEDKNSDISLGHSISPQVFASSKRFISTLVMTHARAARVGLNSTSDTQEDAS